MSQEFEFFEGARTESTTPQITVRRSGQMVLTSSAVALLGDDVTHVQFGYDAGAGAVAIRAAEDGARGRYRLRRQSNGSSLADGRRFFAHHGLKVEKARTFPAESFGAGIVGFRIAETPTAVETEAGATQPKPARGSKSKQRAAA